MSLNNLNQFAASAEFTDVIVSMLSTGKGIHPETAISAAARMAGTLLLRSSRLPLSDFTPATSICSDLVDELGQRVLCALDRALASMDVLLDASNLDYDVGEEHQPRMELIEMQHRFQAPFQSILAKYGLTEEEAAYAAAISAAVLIQHCADFLDPHIGYAIAVWGMVESSKTVPFGAGLGQESVVGVEE